MTHHALAPGGMLGLSPEGVFGGFPAALRRWRVPHDDGNDLRRLVHLLHRGSTRADLDLLLPRHLLPLAEDLVAHGSRDGWLRTGAHDATQAPLDAPGPAPVHGVLVHDTLVTGWRGLGDTTSLVGRRDVALVAHGPDTVVAFWPADTAACAECVGRWYVGTRRHPVETLEALSFEVMTGRTHRTVPQDAIDAALDALTAADGRQPGRAGLAVLTADRAHELRWVGRHPSCTCPAPAQPVPGPVGARRPGRSAGDLAALVVERGVVGSLTVERLASPDGSSYVVAQARVNSAYPRAVAAPLVAFGDAPEDDLATLRCLGEAVERFCTFHPARERLVRATVTELGDDAVPPSSLPLFRPEQYARSGFAHRPPDDASPYLWARATSLSDGRPRWVPAEAVHPGCAVGAPLLTVSSTGVAAHPDRDAAVLAALMEVVERDALSTLFLLRHALPRLAVDDDAVARQEATLAAAGFRLQLFDLTGDAGVPGVLALADRPGGPEPYLLKGAAAAPDLHGAVHQALREVWRGFLYLGSRPQIVPTDLSRLDPSSIEYGMAYYQSDEALATLDVLSGASTAARRAAPAPAVDRGPTDALQAATATLTARGYAPLVVDCTLPVAEEVGFHVVRVVVPGMIPVAFGRRPWQLGGSRLDRLAAAVGAPGVRADLGENGGPPHFFT